MSSLFFSSSLFFFSMTKKRDFFPKRLQLPHLEGGWRVHISTYTTKTGNRRGGGWGTESIGGRHCVSWILLSFLQSSRISSLFSLLFFLFVSSFSFSFFLSQQNQRSSGRTHYTWLVTSPSHELPVPRQRRWLGNTWLRDRLLFSWRKYYWSLFPHRLLVLRYRCQSISIKESTGDKEQEDFLGFCIPLLLSWPEEIPTGNEIPLFSLLLSSLSLPLDEETQVKSKEESLETTTASEARGWPGEEETGESIQMWSSLHLVNPVIFSAAWLSSQKETHSHHHGKDRFGNWVSHSLSQT